MNLLEKYKSWRHQRFLKKHNLTQRQYDLINDPDFSAGGRMLKRGIYHGYPHVHIMSIVPDSFQAWDIHNLIRHMASWCEHNCKGKWRNDWHSVLSHQWIDDEYECNIFGMDIMCFAFKDPKDAVLFALRWS